MTAPPAPQPIQIDPQVILIERQADLQHSDQRRLLLGQSLAAAHAEIARLKARVDELEKQLYEDVERREMPDDGEPTFDAVGSAT